MKTTKLHLEIIAATLLVLCSCGQGNRQSSHRGVYHWKTTYAPTGWEKQWMADHHVDRLYVKLFDVDAGPNVGRDDWKMVPVATTQFREPLPAGMDVVPVVYVTVDAIRQLGDLSWDTKLKNLYATLIVKRIDDMMQDHWNGTIREVQIDCDWTDQTEQTYFDLVEAIGDKLHKRGITLSGTVRLHQMQDIEQYDIPFDRALLMCYNTGSLYSRKTRNSILDFDDVKPYLRQYNSDTLPRTDIAFPVYGWGVEYRKDGSFRRLIHSSDMPEGSNDSVRVEWGQRKEICKTQSALPCLDSNHTIILYHLDSLNLSHYSYEDIETFYSR